MNGYSKIRQPFTSNKSRSMDLSSDSDAIYFSHLQKTNIANNENTQPQKLMQFDYSPDHVESGKGFSSGGFRFSRQRSGRNERLSSTVENAVKKVVSMRRSSSVSERYCKMIYDVDDGLLVDDDGNVAVDTTTSASTKKKMNKKGNGVRIFKACKRLFGF